MYQRFPFPNVVYFTYLILSKKYKNNLRSTTSTFFVWFLDALFYISETFLVHGFCIAAYATERFTCWIHVMRFYRHKRIEKCARAFQSGINIPSASSGSRWKIYFMLLNWIKLGRSRCSERENFWQICKRGAGVMLNAHDATRDCV